MERCDMTIQDAVRDTLAADPALVRIPVNIAPTPSEALPPLPDKIEMGWAVPQAGIFETYTVAPPPVVTTQLCKCCVDQVAVRDGRCFECAEHHEAEAKRLRDLLARALPHVVLRATWYQRDELDELIRDIEAEIGGDDE